jgi:hypothetical protein
VGGNAQGADPYQQADASWYHLRRRPQRDTADDRSLSSPRAAKDAKQRHESITKPLRRKVPTMSGELTARRFTVAHFVGNLSAESINRALAKALIRLAPGGLTFVEMK